MLQLTQAKEMFVVGSDDFNNPLGIFSVEALAIAACKDDSNGDTYCNYYFKLPINALTTKSDYELDNDKIYPAQDEDVDEEDEEEDDDDSNNYY